MRHEFDVRTARGCQPGPLRNRHHRDIVKTAEQALRLTGAITRIIQYDSWKEVISEPHLSSNTLVFVDGGITTDDLNLGEAILVNDGGIISHEIRCGRFYKDGGIIDGRIFECLVLEDAPRQNRLTDDPSRLSLPSSGKNPR